jgi:hypothetical protein
LAIIIEGQRCRLVSRRGQPFAKFTLLAEEIAQAVRAKSAVLGEISVSMRMAAAISISCWAVSTGECECGCGATIHRSGSVPIVDFSEDGISKNLSGIVSSSDSRRGAAIRVL